MADANGAGATLESAMRRLDGAVGSLEAKLSAKLEAMASGKDDLFDADSSQLAAELETARAREKALEQVAAEASAALGRAAAEVRAALQAEG